MRSGVLLTFVAVLVCGCSDGTEGRKPVYPVTGKVTLGGAAPLGGATISFSPKEGQPVAIGKTGDDGVFHMTTYEWQDGAAEGEYDVLITKTVGTSAPATAQEQHAAFESGAGRPSHDGKANKAGGKEESMVNPKYSKKGNGLTASVSASGTNEINFDLEP